MLEANKTNTMSKRIIIFILILFISTFVQSQVVLQPINSSVYEFLDEMAQLKYIELNSAVKPYSRMFIAHKLEEIEVRKGELNKRQQKELAFYFQDFNKELKPKGEFKKRKDLFFYKDSLFTFTVNPILGYEFASNKTGNYAHYFNGGEFYGSVGTHFGFYASLRDNGVSAILSADNHITTLQGANYKLNQGQTGGRSDYSEMIGGIFYSWKWGRVGLVKDNFTWGDNYHGANIRSNKAPSVGYIDFSIKPVKWMELNYTHSWLVSDILDSNRIFIVNQQKREVFVNKNIAANLVTFKPFKNLHVSLGNSVVYADDGVKPFYLIPFMFYKSIDHTYNSAGSNSLGQNTQMFLNISSRQIKHIHLYTSLYIDEISIGKVMDKKNSSNILSVKAGFKLDNFLIPNTYVIAEYTRTNPWAYRHQIESTTYASNSYTLGHYLGENADEIYFEGGFRVVRGLKASLAYSLARKGPEHIYEIINGNANVTGLPFMEFVAWKNQTIEGTLRYEVINDGYIYARITRSEVNGNNSYTPAFYQGNQTTFSGGINFGF